ncbi:unnamed protein product, partial [Prorocentrum cordatum]
VLRISVEQALFGFDVSWSHLGAEKVNIARDRLERPDEVLRLTKMGLQQGGTRGDLYVRLAVDWPQVEKGAKELTLRPAVAGGEARLEREDGRARDPGGRRLETVARSGDADGYQGEGCCQGRHEGPGAVRAARTPREGCPRSLPRG